MRRISFLVIGVLVAMATITGLFYACERNEPECVSEKGLPFLRLSTERSIGDLDKLNATDEAILVEAGRRLQIKSVQGILYTTYTCGKEANMAENIFEYYTCIINRTNKVLGDKRNRTKIAKAGEFEGTKNKCVSALMGYYCKRFQGDTVSYNKETYQAWIETNGYYHTDYVDVRDYGDIMENFYDIEVVPENEWPAEGYHTDVLGSNGECYTVVINKGVSSGHVAMVVDGVSIKVDGYPYMKCFNPQDTDADGNEGCILVDKRTISEIYKVKGFKK